MTSVIIRNDVIDLDNYDKMIREYIKSFNSNNSTYRIEMRKDWKIRGVICPRYYLYRGDDRMPIDLEYYNTGITDRYTFYKFMCDKIKKFDRMYLLSNIIKKIKGWCIKCKDLIVGSQKD